jgi:hypothetical protein
MAVAFGDPDSGFSNPVRPDARMADEILSLDFSAIPKAL